MLKDEVSRCRERTGRGCTQATQSLWSWGRPADWGREDRAGLSHQESLSQKTARGRVGGTAPQRPVGTGDLEALFFTLPRGDLSKRGLIE